MVSNWVVGFTKDSLSDLTKTLNKPSIQRTDKFNLPLSISNHGENASRPINFRYFS